jgi:hypothetical protein
MSTEKEPKPGHQCTRIALGIQAPSNKECHAMLHSKSGVLIDKICLYFWGFVVNHDDDFMSWGFFFWL